MSTPVQDRSPGRARRRDRHELLVDREYAASRDEVLRTVRAKLQAAGVELDDGDLEAAYNQAWHALYLMLADGERIDNRIAMLVTVTHRRALDDHRAQRVDRRTELDPGLPAPRPDVERRLDEQRQLRALRSGMRERLSGRELQAATLCYLHQRSRPEAAEIMGLSPRRMEKIMDRVSKRFGALVRDVQGDWCATQDSLIKAYALGILAPDGERHQLAVDHLADCPSCRRRVLGLRGLAAVAPPLPLLLGGAGLAGGGAAVGADRAGDGGAAGGVGGAVGASAATAAATTTVGAAAGAGTGAAGGATAGGLAGARGAGRVLGRLGRGSTRSNLVAAAAVTATIAVAATATAIALSGGDSNPNGGGPSGGVATEAGPSTGGRGSGDGSGSGPGDGRSAAPDPSAATGGDTPARPTESARGTRSRSSSGPATAKRSTPKRSTRTAGTSSDGHPTGTASDAGTTPAASPPSGSSPAGRAGDRSGTTPPTPPAAVPARPSAPDENAPARGTGSTTDTPAKAPPKVVEDGAEEFELH